MAVSTFTMQDVVDGVLNELRYAPGRDVQIHLQSSIVQDASMLYRMLMTRHHWRDFTNTMIVNTNSTTGEPIEDVSAKLDRFSNLLAVYRENESQPLPFAPLLRGWPKSPQITPSGTAKIWAIYPAQAIKGIQYARIFKDSDFDLADPIPFYKDLLVLGTAYQLATKSGVNMELAALLQKQFDATLSMYQDQELKPQYPVSPAHSGVPMEWYTHDN